MIPADLYELPNMEAVLRARGDTPEPLYSCQCKRVIPPAEFVCTDGLGPDLPRFLCTSCASHPFRVALAAQDERARTLAAAVGDHDWSDVRGERDLRLQRCDWTQMPDAALSDETRESWRAYRQALRDVTNQESPAAVVWPSVPS